jgi:peptide/nickel transport system permease protein
MVSSAVALGWLGIALVAPYLDVNPNAIDLTRMFEEPAGGAWLGYDDLGRSLAARVMHGATVSCLLAFTVVTISGITGVAIGLISGWLGGVVDLIGARIMDMFLAFPGILLAIALAGILGPGLENVLIALCTVGWVGFARLARAQTLSVRQRDHVTVAGALGTTTPIIMIRHVLPLIAAPLIVEATFAVAAVIIAEAGLSFLGLGVQPPTPSWGSMIRDGTRFMLVAPHMVVVPGVALFTIVVAVNVLGDRLRDRWHVKDD